MVRVVQREQTGISLDYENQPPNRRQIDKNNGVPPERGLKLIRVVAVGFGLLCVLQVALNVFLRLALLGGNLSTQGEHANCTQKGPGPSPSQESSRGPSCCEATTLPSVPPCRPIVTDEYFEQGWILFQSSLYYISSTKKSWQESRKDCRRRGSDLVIIDTKGEQNFTRLFHDHTWIGLYNDKKTGQWTWVDGTPLTKSYWGPGEPNNFGVTVEDCVEIRFHETENSWNDIPCANQNIWICEKNVAL